MINYLIIEDDALPFSSWYRNKCITSFQGSTAQNRGPTNDGTAVSLFIHGRIANPLWKVPIKKHIVQIS